MKNSYITITDQFCGAGGSSLGASWAAERLKVGSNGLEIKLALNHWNLAIETHNTNFPNTLHDCTDVSACDPRRYPSTDILITSPECTNHSLAKGKKRKGNGVDLFTTIDPAEERSRATMWDVPRFAEYHKYNIIIVENVVDARYWVMFDAWLMAMHALGYLHKCVYMNSMFCHPTPQSRDRMYVVFWKKGNKAPDLEQRPEAHCNTCGHVVESVQAWKRQDKKWGKYKQQYIFRCSQCSTEVTPFYYAAFNAIDWSIPGQRIGDREKPLADNTMKRIRYGLDKFGNQQLLVYMAHTHAGAKRAAPATVPIGTQTAYNNYALVNPMMVRNFSPGYTKPVTDETGTITTSDHHGVVMPMIVTSRYTSGIEHRIKEAMTEPIGTQPGDVSHGVLVPFVIKGEHTMQEGYVKSGEGPMMTQATRQSMAVVVPQVVQANRTGHSNPAYQALSTVLAGGNHHGVLQAPFMVENYEQSNAKEITRSMGTLTTKIKHGIVSHESLSSFLGYYYGKAQVSGMAEPVGTQTTRDRNYLVSTEPNPDAKAIDINDCTYRMLKPHEIKKAMAFPTGYTILGNSRDQTKQCGNAVTPPAMEWLVGRCIESLM